MFAISNQYRADFRECFTLARISPAAAAVAAAAADPLPARGGGGGAGRARFSPLVTEHILSFPAVCYIQKGM
jgi:hypothetical protein